MSSIIEYFKNIVTIPHCSQDADRLLEYLSNFAKERDYSVSIDSSKNLLISKGRPRLALQAHYDMVCMGDAPSIEIYEEDGWLRAKNSSLGADNGIAIAMMMTLMDRGDELEFLLTSDEEIGLIGATALSFDLSSKYMLNLDSEDEAEVYIGCAGGVDIVATKPYRYGTGDGDTYRVSIDGLPGGHSGVDIDRGIPNAIKILASYLKDRDVDIVDISGGERLNSIPSSAYAILKSKEDLIGSDMVEVESIEDSKPAMFGASEIIDLLNDFDHGVRDMNEQFKIPQTSINLAMVSIKDGICTIESSARAISSESLDRITKESIDFFKSYGFDVESRDKYPSWQPDINSFTKIVDSSMKEVYGESKMVVIHAGLECGVISQKYPDIQIASIGPTIRYPHSTREEVKLDSVEMTFEVLKRVVETI